MIVSTLAWGIALAAGVPTAMLGIECLAGSRTRTAPEPTAAPPFVVVMPAHDEASGIEASVRSALAQLRACDELLVVADNCIDDTATRARALGATVIERNQAALRGKGHALDYARGFIATERPKCRVVVVLDADCRALPGSLPALAARAAARGGRGAAVQGIFLLPAPEEAPPVVRISSFAFLIKNLVRQQGLERLSGAALLHGSGMAFPRAMFLGMRWPGGSLVEDLEMGLTLLLRRDRVIVEPAAIVLSAPSTIAGTGSQRRRWEHGMMQTAWRYVPRLLARAVRRPGLAVVALDLIVPPTVLLVLGSAAASVIVLALAGVSAPFLTLLAAQLLAFTGLARAWWSHGREALPPESLRQLPAYLLWKLPLIAQFVTRRQRVWTRTERLP